MMSTHRIKLEEINKCPICYSKCARFIFYGIDVQFSKTLMAFPLVKCTNCGLVYLRERPHRDFIHMFYPEDVYPAYREYLAVDEKWSIRIRFKESIKARLKKRKNKLLDRLLFHIVPAHWRLAVSFPLKSKILDVGCGAGWSLDVYKEFGWETYGYDFSEEAIRIAKAKGHNVYRGQIGDIKYPDNYFDAIQVCHVIEHLPDPVFTIRKVHSLLKENGLLLIETPNQIGLLAKLFKGDYWQIDSPRHLQLFSRTTLTFLLTNCGLYLHQIKTKSTKYGIINSIQALVTRKYGKEKHIKNNLFLKLFNLLFFCIAIPINLLGMGENVILFARKRRNDKPT